MSGWTARKFWTDVAVTAEEGGHAIRLDGRPVRSPAKAHLVLPTRALAEAIAEEWRAQGEVIRPEAMPMTRTANSALDKVAPRMAEVVDHLTDYGATDLLCYRADAPETLAQRQAEAWDPWLDWAAERFGGRLDVTEGVIPVPQPPAALAALRAPLLVMSPFELAAVHDLVTLPGSLVLGLAVADGAGDAVHLWDLSRLDETFQAELWGWDEEADRVAALKRQAFLDAARFRDLAMPDARPPGGGRDATL